MVKCHPHDAPRESRRAPGRTPRRARAHRQGRDPGRPLHPEAGERDRRARARPGRRGRGDREHCLAPRERERGSRAGPAGRRAARVGRPRADGACARAARRQHPVMNATLHTSGGAIDLELYPDDAPKTVENFVKLSRDGFYEGVIFHRVIPDFMIQGGDPTGTGMGGPGYQFEDEFNQHRVVRGALAMANAGPNTNGSQFFIVTAEETPWLDGKHTVFGRVTSGMDVVDRISEADRDENDRPRTPVTIDRVEISED